MSNSHIDEQDFGYFHPGKSTLLLRTVTKLGISRGAIRRWVSTQWLKKGYAIVDATVRGLNYRLHIQENTTDNKILTSSKFYDAKEISALASRLNGYSDSSDSVFVDIGANTGYYSLNLAQLGYKKVIAIEPNPKTLSILLFNVKANQMEDTISVVPICIGNGDDIPFYCSNGLGS